MLQPDIQRSARESSRIARGDIFFGNYLHDTVQFQWASCKLGFHAFLVLHNASIHSHLCPVFCSIRQIGDIGQTENEPFPEAEIPQHRNNLRRTIQGSLTN